MCCIKYAKEILRYIAMYQKLSILASDKITQFIADENQAISQG